MQEITLEDKIRQFERIVNHDGAQIRHRANQDVAAYAQKLVRSYAPLSNTPHRGRLRNWQEGREQGNRGGYVKVQAAKSPSGKNGAGAITNYVENGHINHRGGRRVPGAQFYAAARPLAEAYAKRRFRQAGDEIAKILNGG